MPRQSCSAWTSIPPSPTKFPRYRPPDADTATTRAWTETIIALCDSATHRHLIFGDFNTPNVIWGEDGEAPESGPEGVVWEAMDVELGLEQRVPEPTRRNRATGRWTLLDLLFTDDESLVSSCSVREPFSTADHLSVVATLAIAAPDHSAIPKLNWRAAEWENLAVYFAEIPDQRWTQANAECLDTNAFCDVIYDTLLNAANLYVPPLRLRPPGCPQELPRHLTHLKRLKHRAARKGLNSPKAKKAAHRYRAAVARHFRRTEWAKIKEKGRGPTLHGWMRERAKPRAVVLTLKTERGPATMDHEKATALRETFQGVYVSKPCPPEPPPPFGPQPCPPPDLADISCHAHEVFQTLRRLSNKMSCGPDGLPLILYKRCAPQLAFPLALLFRRSLDEGRLPDLWSHASIVPVFKRKGERSNPANYRQVSMTCALCRVMERHITFRLRHHLETDKSKSQWL